MIFALAILRAFFLPSRFRFIILLKSFQCLFENSWISFNSTRVPNSWLAISVLIPLTIAGCLAIFALQFISCNTWNEGLGSIQRIAAVSQQEGAKQGCKRFLYFFKLEFLLFKGIIIRGIIILAGMAEAGSSLS